MVSFSDIHTHILPNIDDGAENIQTAMEMLRMAYNDGTRVLFLTPHCKDSYNGHDNFLSHRPISWDHYTEVRTKNDYRLAR